MSNYKIINDESELKGFVGLLPDLKDNEAFYFSLFSRKKYNPIVRTNKNILKRCTASRDRILTKVRQMEVPYGAYTIDGTDDSQPVPQDSLVLYMSANPRDLYQAGLRVIGELAKNAIDNRTFNNPHKQVLSMIQKTRGSRHFTCFDVDSKEDGKLERIKELIPEPHRIIIETRGGYHVLVYSSKFSEVEIYMGNKFWYKDMQEISDINGDMLIAVPGTCHGGFVPRIVS